MFKKLFLSFLLITTSAQSMYLQSTEDMYTAVKANNYKYLNENQLLLRQCNRQKIKKLCLDNIEDKKKKLPSQFSSYFWLAMSTSFSTLAAFLKFHPNFNFSTLQYWGFSQAIDDQCLSTRYPVAELAAIGACSSCIGLHNCFKKKQYETAIAIKQLLLTRGLIDANEINEDSDNEG